MGGGSGRRADQQLLIVSTPPLSLLSHILERAMKRSSLPPELIHIEHVVLFVSLTLAIFPAFIQRWKQRKAAGCFIMHQLMAS